MNYPTKRVDREPPVRINSGSSLLSVESSLTSSVDGHRGSGVNNYDFIYVRDVIYA